MSTRHKSDHAWKNCTMPGCDRPLRAKGKCAACYNKDSKRPDRHARTKVMQCFICDKEVLKPASRGNRYAVTCSNECKRTLTFGTPLPEDHWARWWGKTSRWAPPKAKAEQPAAFISNTCNECAEPFIERNNYNPSAYCSRSCARRVAKRARKAREHNAPGEFRWIEVIRMWMAGGKACAYCDTTMTGQPDPDHVTPLSRGGRNDIGNIVACCRNCNADKCDLTLDEWAIERMRLGKAPLRYVLDRADPRFSHLTLTTATGTAWRHSFAVAA